MSRIAFRPEYGCCETASKTRAFGPPGCQATASINGEQPVYEELYDIVNDPLERDNVIDDPANAEILDKLRAGNANLVKELRGTQPFDTYHQVNRVGKDG